MADADRIEELLGCLIKVVARAAIPEDKVREVVGSGAKQIKAFNLCDGTRSQLEVAKQSGLDQGNLSRTAVRWIQNGVMFSLGNGRDARLLHVYPIPAGSSKPKVRGKRRKRG